MSDEFKNEFYKEEDAIDIVSDCYTDLSKYVAETRAYCSTVDGLKAVARRTIFASRPYTKKVKSVAIVGDALKHHPHGDGNVYGALVAMTCSYGRFPLFVGKGNFGGLGSRCAAMRYTEACLSDLARVMYMELIDYAEFVEGETGNKEPRRLPALLPYAYLVGAGGIPVGLPGANIPSVDCLQLVDYYIAKLKGEEGIVPLPDFGDCIIDVAPEEAREVIKRGHGRLTFKGNIIQEDEHKFVLTDCTPYKSIWNVLDKLKWYLDEDIVDYTDESSDSPRYVFEIYDRSKISPEELKGILEKALACSKTYKTILVDDDSSAANCGIDYVVDSGIKYLQECSIRKFTHHKEKTEKLRAVLLAVTDLRNSGKLSEIVSMTQEEVSDFIVTLGHSPEIAWEATKKPISYLTRSHDAELKTLSDDIDLYDKYINNPNEYLLTLYAKLRPLVEKHHSNITHSRVGVGLTNGEVECYAKLVGNTIQTYDSKVEGSIEWKYNLHLVRPDGNLDTRKISKTPGVSIELDYEPVGMCSDKMKYVMVLADNHRACTVHNLENIKNNWVNDSNVVFKYVFATDQPSIKVLDGKDYDWDFVFDDWVRKRRGPAKPIANKGLVKVDNITL